MTTTIRDHWRGLTDALTADQIAELEADEHHSGTDADELRVQLFQKAESFVCANYDTRLAQARERLADHPLPAGAVSAGDWTLEGIVPWRWCEGETVTVEGGAARAQVRMEQSEDGTNRFLSLQPLPVLNVHDVRAVARALMAVADRMVEDSERD